MLALATSVDASWRTQNLGHLLFTARDCCIRDKLSVLHARGFGMMTDAQLALFHHLDRDGSRLTDLALRGAMTKSSMSELIDRAAMLGLVERVSDDGDARAKRVRCTPAGDAFLLHLDAAVDFADTRFAAVVGNDAMLETMAALGRYGVNQGGTNIGRLLSGAARRFAEHVLDTVHAEGHLELAEPHLNLFRALDLRGSRLTELAKRAGVTKQSMRETVSMTAALGYIAQHSDPDDGRARRIAFTPAGLAMLERFRRAVEDVERGGAALLGESALTELRRQLKIYIAPQERGRGD